MTLYDIKPRFQSFLRPLVRRWWQMGVTANQVTVTATVGSVVVGLIVANNVTTPAVFLMIPVWMFIRMALNAIDGLLAREFGQKSQLGAVLNEAGDVISDLALILPFMLVSPFSVYGVALVALLAVLSEFVGVLSLTVGASRRYDGPMGKSDRALVFGALGFWFGLAGTLPSWTAWMMPALSLFLVITIVNRAKRAFVESN